MLDTAFESMLSKFGNCELIVHANRTKVKILDPTDEGAQTLFSPEHIPGAINHESIHLMERNAEMYVQEFQKRTLSVLMLNALLIICIQWK